MSKKAKKQWKKQKKNYFNIIRVLDKVSGDLDKAADDAAARDDVCCVETCVRAKQLVEIAALFLNPYLEPYLSTIESETPEKESLEVC